MRKQNNERGFLTFTGVIMILVLAAVVFASFKLLPPYIKNYQLQDSISNIARTVTYNNATSEDIRKEVLASARDIGIALEPGQVFAEKAGPTVNIAVDYTINVDLMVEQVELHFNPTAGNKIITAK